jgi:FkbM family methyltransferase
LDLPISYSRSFIAQCIPAKGYWMHDLINYLEKTNASSNWIVKIIDSIDFSEYSGFSEYELLGNFFISKYPDEFKPQKGLWMRSGKLIPRLHDMTINPIFVSLLKPFVDFVAFEQTFSFERTIRSKIRSIKKALRSALPKQNADLINCFLESYFSTSQVKNVVQVGANDGIQNDQIRRFLDGNYTDKCMLVEPLPYYAQKLSLLYKEQPNITILQAAVSSIVGPVTLFYIDPEIAEEMNGIGPMNNWAHGQGAFDPETIKYWIRKNSFRGSQYRTNIPKYISSILKADVITIRLEDILCSDSDNTLLVIDVQGAELDVLLTLGHCRPRYIIIEDDLGRGNKVKTYLLDHGYRSLGGSTDKLFQYDKSGHASMSPV